MIEGVRFIDTAAIAEPRGTLVPFEFDGLPFVPQRMFVVRDVPPGTLRGSHGHRRQSQILICLAGRIELRLRRGGQTETMLLDRPERGVLIGPGVWSEQLYLVAGSMLCVLSSGPYDPADFFDSAS